MATALHSIDGCVFREPGSDIEYVPSCAMAGCPMDQYERWLVSTYVTGDLCTVVRDGSVKFQFLGCVSWSFIHEMTHMFLLCEPLTLRYFLEDLQELTNLQGLIRAGSERKVSERYLYILHGYRTTSVNW